MRQPNGTFAPGNPGGPGRPRRAVEADYLRTLADAVPQDTWREIVERAVIAAKNGDAAARTWLTRYLIGAEPDTLHRLAVLDALDVGSGDLVNADAERERLEATSYGIVPGSLEVIFNNRAAAAAEAERLEAARVRAERRAARNADTTSEAASGQ